MSTPDDIYNKLPWLKPKTTFDNDGAECHVTIDGHVFSVQATGRSAIYSGRMRWRVECTTCGTVIHPGSTSARVQIERHLEDKKAERS